MLTFPLMMDQINQCLVSAVLLGAVLTGACSPSPGEPAAENEGLPAYANEALDAEYVKRMRESGAEALKRQRSPEWRGMLQLHNAVDKGDRELTERFLDLGYEVDARDIYEQTVLMRAASNGDLLMLDLLLEHGADPDAQDRFGNTALLHACSGGYARLVQRLLEEDAWVGARPQRGGSAIYRAVSSGSIPMVRLLIRSGIKIDERTRDALVAQAERKGYDEVARLIQQASADQRRRSLR